MSAYKKITTEFKNLESLKKALHDLGLPADVSVDGKTNTLPLVGYSGNMVAKAAIRIPRAKLNAYEDTGFIWNGSSYEAMISTHDGKTSYNQNVGTGTLDQIKQRYTLHEARRLAWMQGYTLQEQTLQDGSIQLTCTRR